MILHRIKKNKDNQLYKKASVCLLIKIIGTLAGFALYLWISRQYGAEGMGVFSLFNIILGLFGIFSCLGLTSSCIRFIPQILASKNPQDLLKLRNVQWLISMFSTTIGVIILITMSDTLAVILFHKAEYRFIIIIIALILPFYVLNLIGIEFLRALNYISLFEYFRSAHVQLGGLFLLLILGNFYTQNTLPILISSSLYLVGFLLVWFKIQHHLNQQEYSISKTSRYTIGSVLKVSLPMLITAFSALLIERVDALMLAYFHGSYEVGLYSIAFKLASLIMFLIIPLNSVLIPKISHAFWGNELGKVKHLLSHGSYFMFWAAFCCLIFMWLFSEKLLNIFGNEFVEASTALLFLSLGFFFNAIFGIGEHLLNLSGNQKTLTKIFSLALLLNITLNFLLIPNFSIQGAAFASMLSMILWNVLAGILINKRLNLTIIYMPFLSDCPNKIKADAN